MKGFLVGHCHERDGYRVWVPEKQDVVLSRDVVFKDEQLLQEKVEISTALKRKRRKKTITWILKTTHDRLKDIISGISLKSRNLQDI